MWTLEELEQDLNTTRAQGLSDALATEKFKRHGENTLTERGKVPWYIVFIKEQTGFFSLLLWLGSILCFIAYGISASEYKKCIEAATNVEEENQCYLDPSNLYLGIVLGTVVFVTGCFSYFQTSKAVSLMDDFKNFIPREALVLREGAWISIESRLLVPGDIVKIKGGDNVPADMIMYETNEMKVNNASLTGEPEELLRKPDLKA